MAGHRVMVYPIILTLTSLQSSADRTPCQLPKAEIIGRHHDRVLFVTSLTPHSHGLKPPSVSSGLTSGSRMKFDFLPWEGGGNTKTYSVRLNPFSYMPIPLRSSH